MLKIIEIGTPEDLVIARPNEVVTNDYLYILKYNNSFLLVDNGTEHYMNSIINMTQTEYDALTEVNNSLLYMVSNTVDTVTTYSIYYAGTKIDTHTHDNKDVLDLFSQDVDGKLLFNGSPIEGISGGGETHTHDNKSTLDKLSENASGNLLFDGEAIEGGGSSGGTRTSSIETEDMPIGSIINYIGDETPEHYLKCDGTIYAIVDYPKLSNHILNQYGSCNYFGGDGITTFAVPNQIGDVSEVKDITPTMTSNTSPYPYTVSASSYFDSNYMAWKAFNKTVIDSYDAWVTPVSITTGWLKIDLGSRKIAHAFSVTARNISAANVESPKNIVVYGSNDDVTYDVLFTSSDEINWTLKEERTFTLTKQNAYRYYKFDILSNNGDNNLSIGDIKLLSYVYNFVPYIKAEPSYYGIYEVSNPLTTTDISQESPVGSVIDYIGIEVPEHYLKCDGRVYNISDYPYLAEHFLKVFGSYNYYGGDGVTTFGVPQDIPENLDTFSPGMETFNTPEPYVVSADGYSSSYPPYCMFDGTDNTSCWVVGMGSGPHWVAIDLGTKKTINGFVLTSRNGVNATTGAPKDFVLSGSNDGVNFIDIKSFSGITWSSSKESQLFELNDIVSYRHYKLTITANNGYSNLIIGDMSFIQSLTRFKCIKYEPTHYAVNQYGGFESTVLFEGNANTIGKYELADDIKNYDFLLVGSTGSKLIPEQEIDVVPQMTSNTAPEPYVVSSSSIHETSYQPYKVFDKTNGSAVSNCFLFNQSETSGWIMIDLGSYTVINKFKITSRNYASAIRHPMSFTLQGSNDGVNFDDIMSVDNQIDWMANETREYRLDKTVGYRFYRLNNVTSSSGNGYVAIGEFGLFYSIAETQKDTDSFSLIQIQSENDVSNRDYFSEIKAIDGTNIFIPYKFPANTQFEIINVSNLGWFKSAITKIIGIKGKLPTLLMGGEF